MLNRNIVVSQTDMERLQDFLAVRNYHASRDVEHFMSLQAELERADIVPDSRISKNVVSMHTRVLVRDLDTGVETEYTLVFPPVVDLKAGNISVLTPIGTALLGYRKGDTIEFSTPGGVRRLRIKDVIYQPAASGDELARSPPSCPNGSEETGRIVPRENEDASIIQSRDSANRLPSFLERNFSPTRNSSAQLRRQWRIAESI